jgi:uncharacterized membrane protein (UPF0127 family)
VTCEVASTFALRAAGLSGRAAVPPGTGMLFLYSEADTRGFWMKGCLVPLDIAYVRDDGVVVDVGRLEAPPRGVDDDALPRFRSTQPVRVVFEAAAGEFARLGVVPGVTLRLPDGLPRDSPTRIPEPMRRHVPTLIAVLAAVALTLIADRAWRKPSSDDVPGEARLREAWMRIRESSVEDPDSERLAEGAVAGNGRGRGSGGRKRWAPPSGNCSSTRRGRVDGSRH